MKIQDLKRIKVLFNAEANPVSATLYSEKEFIVFKIRKSEKVALPDRYGGYVDFTIDHAQNTKKTR